MEAVSSAELPKNTDLEEYDLVVLGSGTGSKVAGWTTAEQGKRVVLIERQYIGDSCHNIACLPSKNIIHSAKVASVAAHAAAFGIDTNAIAINMAGVQRRKRQMVEDLVQVHLTRYEASGVDLIMGEAHFVAPKTIVVNRNDGGTRSVSGQQVVLSLGSRATIPDVPGLVDARPMAHVEARQRAPRDNGHGAVGRRGDSREPGGRTRHDGRRRLTAAACQASATVQITSPG